MDKTILEDWWNDWMEVHFEKIDIMSIKEITMSFIEHVNAMQEELKKEAELDQGQ